MGYRFEFRPYQRKFERSLSTSRGIWEIREGIIIRLTDETGNFGFGEIAPLSWFGSESMQQAVDFCRQLDDAIATETIFTIPASLPACQFGFESAWETVTDRPVIPQSRHLNPLTYSALLPAGEAALQTWQMLYDRGYRTFKWKIGVAPIKDEIEVCDRLMKVLPASAKLRLDANGGLSYSDANKWLQVCDDIGGIIEFIEQPLPVGEFEAMLELCDRYLTPVALDESVATIPQMQTAYQNGWRSIFVIKPSIAGYLSQLREFCLSRNIDAVFSSVFETEIGRQAALKLAAEFQKDRAQKNRAVGFGVNHWFKEDDELWLNKLWQIS